MNYVIVRHKVKNYERWKEEFDEHYHAKKKEAEFGKGFLLRNSGDPNEVVLMVELRDMEKARQFFSSTHLKEAMEEGGVIEKPDIYMLQLVEELKPAELVSTFTKH